MLCPSIGTQPDLFFVHLSFDRSSDQKIIRRIKIQVTDGIASECIRSHIRFHISLQVFDELLCSCLCSLIRQVHISIIKIRSGISVIIKIRDHRCIQRICDLLSHLIICSPFRCSFIFRDRIACHNHIRPLLSQIII